MNLVRLTITIIVVAVFFCAYEVLFHTRYMVPIYEQDPGWMRDQAGTLARMKWVLAGFFLMAIGFVLIWAMGFESKGIKFGLIYGLALAVLGSGWQLLSYFSQPIPEAVIVRWIPAVFIEFGLAGILTALIYRPKKRVSESESPPSELFEAVARQNAETE